MNKILLFLTCALILSSCYHKRQPQAEVEEVTQEFIDSIVFLVNQKKQKDSTVVVTNAIYTKQEIATWRLWFKDNHKNYVYLYGRDSISPSHNDGIDELLSLFYNGNDTLRHDYRMIQWRLDEFYPIKDDNEDEFVQYQNLKMQIDSLLNFNTDRDYRTRYKSALTRLMYEFRIKMYEEKLAGSMRKELQTLFDEEKKAWIEYYEAASDAFGINVLRKESYFLKYVFWNNYDFDIMSHRLQSLLYMYFKEPSLLADAEEGDWEKVEQAYEHLKGQIECVDAVNDYSCEEKLDALTKEEEAFRIYMEGHSRLLQKLDVCDGSQLLYLKEQTLKNYHHYDDVAR